MPSLGIQLMQTTALGTKSGIRFVPFSIIKDVVINETIRRVKCVSPIILSPSDLFVSLC